jgi:hypothetical protein
VGSVEGTTTVTSPRDLNTNGRNEHGGWTCGDEGVEEEERRAEEEEDGDVMAEVANETWKNGYIDDGRASTDNNWYAEDIEEWDR